MRGMGGELPTGLPYVTVLTCVYNGARFLDEAMASIHRQTFTDFEYLVIDDASVDATPEILSAWAARDARIRVVRNATNLGLTRSLNIGIALARGVWIARQDADDWSLPGRLATQIDFLEHHPEIGLLGSAAWWIDEQGQQGPAPLQPACEHTEICWQSLFYSPFYHTAVIYRRSLVQDEPYDESFRYGQDIELWGRLLRQTRGANLPEPLVCVRRHGGRVSAVHFASQQRTGWEVASRQCRALCPEFVWSPEEMRVVRGMAESEWPRAGESPEGLIMGLRLLRAFLGQGGWDPQVSVQLQKRLLRRCWRSGFGWVKHARSASLWLLVREMGALSGWLMGEALWEVVIGRFGGQRASP